MEALLRTLFFAPHSIFFLPFLASAILITVLWLRFSQKKNLKESLKLLFDSRVWLTKDAAIDLLFSFLMLLGIAKIIAPLENLIFTHILDMGRTPPTILEFQLPPVLESLLATLIAMLAYDLASYATHRAMHRNLLLWRIHAFHHSAEKLTFFTTYRQNPIEPIVLAATRNTAAALSLLVFRYFFPAQTPVFSVLGLGAGFFLYMFTVNLHHSPIPVRYPRFLRKILISPHVHHLHHSREARHEGKNYGVVFSFWDRWFKTYHEEEVGLRSENPLQEIKIYQPPPPAASFLG